MKKITFNTQLNQRQLTFGFTAILVMLTSLHVYVVLQGGRISGVIIPFILYILYITITYSWRWGIVSAVIIWATVIYLISSPIFVFKFDADTFMSFVWALTIVIAGQFIRKIKLNQEDEIQSREIYSSSAAHEMKTPLTVLKMYGQIVEKKHPEIGAVIDKEVNRLQQLIEKMMDYSKIREGNFSLRFEKFYLIDVVEDVVSEIQHINPTCRIYTRFPKKRIIVCADKLAIEQVIVNLVNNAVKHCSEKDITIRTRRRNHKWAQIQVQDKGKGIPKELHKTIFSPFTQGEKSSQGLGLGLFICRKLVELHNGRIYFNTSDKGTTFFVDIPLKRELVDYPSSQASSGKEVSKSLWNKLVGNK